MYTVPVLGRRAAWRGHPGQSLSLPFRKGTFWLRAVWLPRPGSEPWAPAFRCWIPAHADAGARCPRSRWQRQLDPKLPAIWNVGPWWQSVCRSHRSQHGCSVHSSPSPVAVCSWSEVTRASLGKVQRPLPGKLLLAPEVHFIYTTRPIRWARPLHSWPQNFRKTQLVSFERCRNKSEKLHCIYIDNWGLFFFFPSVRGRLLGGVFPLLKSLSNRGIFFYFFSLARCSLLAPWLTCLLDCHLFHVPFPVLMVNRVWTVN